MELAKASLDRLPAYTDALKTGWSPDNLRLEVAREQLDAASRDPQRFVATFEDLEAKGDAIVLPDGSRVPRLPGFQRWIWDDGFCGIIGLRWQPDPLLRRVAQAPVHTLAVQSRAMASLRILHEQRLRSICAAVPHGHAYMPEPGDPKSIARTATGRVLYATQHASEAMLPDCWTRREWHQLRESLRDSRATVIDHQDAVAGMCCVSAPVWWPSGACAGAVTVIVEANNPPAGLPSLVLDAACRIGTALQQLRPG